jgi:hypothetical protein
MRLFPDLLLWQFRRVKRLDHTVDVFIEWVGMSKLMHGLHLGHSAQIVLRSPYAQVV